MEDKKKRSAGLLVAAIILGVVCALSLACLVLSLLISPGKSEEVIPEVLADFEDNSLNYYDIDTVTEYKSSAAVEYGASAAGGIDTSNGLYTGFVFPDSDTELITQDMMRETLTEAGLCRRAINEIYARHGYQFTKQENIDYFNQYDWYRNMTKETNMSVVSSRFSTIEKKNVESLQAYENSKGWN